jgi:Flp pilus assembly protein TadG
MSRARARAIGSERGAVFVQVGISLFVLMAFNVFVLDYGMMWIARGQAQNAADAGAIAGAIARAYEDPDASSGLAAAIATEVAEKPRLARDARRRDAR